MRPLFKGKNAKTEKFCNKKGQRRRLAGQSAAQERPVTTNPCTVAGPGGRFTAPLRTLSAGGRAGSLCPEANAYDHPREARGRMETGRSLARCLAPALRRYRLSRRCKCQDSASAGTAGRGIFL